MISSQSLFRRYASFFVPVLCASALGSLTSSAAEGGELAYKSDFETGAIQNKSSNPDGWMVQSIETHELCQDPGKDYSYATNVVTSDNEILPRAGQRMLRIEVREGDYGVGNPCGKSNERANLKIAPELAEAHIQYNTTSWVGFSIYLPSAENSPDYTEILAQLSTYPPQANQIAMIFSYRPESAGDTTPTSFRIQCYSWEDFDSKNQCVSTKSGVGGQNPIDAHLDEWLDFRLEIKLHETDGVLKLWSRRPTSTDDFTLEVDYSGPFGGANLDALGSLSIYGGGGFPLVAYFDEYKITNSKIGSAEDVDTPTGVLRPRSPVLLEE
jgi:hypothetical protein